MTFSKITSCLLLRVKKSILSKYFLISYLSKRRSSIVINRVSNLGNNVLTRLSGPIVISRVSNLGNNVLTRLGVIGIDWTCPVVVCRSGGLKIIQASQIIVTWSYALISERKRRGTLAPWSRDAIISGLT